MLVQTLLEQLPEDSNPVVAVVKPEPGSPNPAKQNGGRVQTIAAYNSSVIYILELATILSIKNRDTVLNTGKDVVEALFNVVRDWQNWHPIIVSRVLLYLLHLLKACHVG